MNLQPSEAEAGFDIRVPPTADPESLERQFAEEWAPVSRNMTFQVLMHLLGGLYPPPPPRVYLKNMKLTIALLYMVTSDILELRSGKKVMIMLVSFGSCFSCYNWYLSSKIKVPIYHEA